MSDELKAKLAELKAECDKLKERGKELEEVLAACFEEPGVPEDVRDRIDQVLG